MVGKWASGLVAMFLAGALNAGCSRHVVGEQDDFMHESLGDNARAVLHAQASRGAVRDGTLYPMHFDGRKLNSLGKQKLGLMLERREQDAPLEVYLDLEPADATARARVDAVSEYLKEHNLAASEFTVEVAANPDTYHPAADGLTRMRKTESTDAATGGYLPSGREAGPRTGTAGQ